MDRRQFQRIASIDWWKPPHFPQNGLDHGSRTSTAPSHTPCQTSKVFVLGWVQLVRTTTTCKKNSFQGSQAMSMLSLLYHFLNLSSRRCGFANMGFPWQDMHPSLPLETRDDSRVARIPWHKTSTPPPSPLLRHGTAPNGTGAQNPSAMASHGTFLPAPSPTHCAIVYRSPRRPPPPKHTNPRVPCPYDRSPLST